MCMIQELTYNNDFDQFLFSFKFNRSTFCLLNLMGNQRQSTMRITPTPRAISPQDIVRIYVPAAPPEEAAAMRAGSAANLSPTTDNTHFRYQSSAPSQSGVQVANGGIKLSIVNGGTSTVVGTPLSEKQSNRNSLIFGSGDITPVRQRLDEDLIQSFGEASLSSIGNISNSGQHSTSSSRRGSLSRKSPSVINDSAQWECRHILQRRLSTSSSNDKKYGIVDTSSENLSPNVDHHQERVLTSFEQLAARQRQHNAEQQQKRISHDTNRSYSDHDGINKSSFEDDEKYTYTYYNVDKSPRLVTAGKTTKKYVSESNIQNKVSASPNELKHTNDKRQPHSGASKTTHTAEFIPIGMPSSKSDQIAAPTTTAYQAPAAAATTTSTEEYKRFYGTSVDDDDDDEEEPKRSSDDSSSSHNSKSTPNTPHTEMVPLLSSPITVVPLNRGPPTTPQKEEQRPPHHPQQPQRYQHFHTKTSKSSQIVQQTVSHHQSRIPLLQSSNLSSTNNTTTQQQSFSDLNRVLPPIETTQRNVKISSQSTDKHYSVNTHPKYALQKNGSAGSNSGGDPSTLRIEVIQNRRD